MTDFIEFPRVPLLGPNPIPVPPVYPETVDVVNQDSLLSVGQALLRLDMSDEETVRYWFNDCDLLPGWGWSGDYQAGPDGTLTLIRVYSVPIPADPGFPLDLDPILQSLQDDGVPIPTDEDLETLSELLDHYPTGPPEDHPTMALLPRRLPGSPPDAPEWTQFPETLPIVEFTFDLVSASREEDPPHVGTAVRCPSQDTETGIAYLTGDYSLPDGHNWSGDWWRTGEEMSLRHLTALPLTAMTAQWDEDMTGHVEDVLDQIGELSVEVPPVDGWDGTIPPDDAQVLQIARHAAEGLTRDVLTPLLQNLRRTDLDGYLTLTVDLDVPDGDGWTPYGDPITASDRVWFTVDHYGRHAITISPGEEPYADLLEVGDPDILHHHVLHDITENHGEPTLITHVLLPETEYVIHGGDATIQLIEPPRN